jgi:hypothetical protein
MKSQTKPRTTSAKLSAQLTKHIQALAGATDAARLSDDMQAYLETCARFHQYSYNNIWLIMMAKPDARRVAGFQRWKQMGRYVRKGEKGIPILAPITRKDEDDSGHEITRLAGFKVVYVFDISQTDGEPLPDAPEWKSPQQNAELQARLVAYAESQGIRVQIQSLSGETQGVSLGGEIHLSPEAGTKTLIHEIAHELIHRDRLGDDKTILELEAEAVAYVVGTHFGITDLASPNYIALHGADSEMILAHMARIQETAAEIIGELEKESER